MIPYGWVLAHCLYARHILGEPEPPDFHLDRAKALGQVFVGLREQRLQ